MTAAMPPMVYRWDGSHMVPLDINAAQKSFRRNWTYRLFEHVNRSGRSHRHYFACVRQAWMNLPDEQARRWPTSEHLRKFALIRTGHCRQRIIVCSSTEDAMSLVALVEVLDEHCICTVQGPVVTVATALSQSTRAMGKKTFQKSKQDVIDYLADLIGVTTDELVTTAKRFVNDT